MSMYGVLNRIYKKIPYKIRNAIYRYVPGKKLRIRLIHNLGKDAEHDEIYDKYFYIEKEEPYMLQSVDIISDTIMEVYKPASVIDIGCGTGLLIQNLRDKGIAGVTGVEYSTAAIEIGRDRGLAIIQHDLEKDDPLKETYDVAVSLEVAEHLPESVADRYIDQLCSLSDNIFFTAALPSHGGGTDHVNEQPHSYWIVKFNDRGYRYNDQLTQNYRKKWQDKGVLPCYYTNLMLFNKNRT